MHSHLRDRVIMYWFFIEFCVSSVCCFSLSLRRRRPVVTVWRGFTSVVLIFPWWRCGACIHSIFVDRLVFSCYFVSIHGCADAAFSILPYEGPSAVVLVCVLAIVFLAPSIAFEACVLMLFDALFVVVLRMVPRISSA